MRLLILLTVLLAILIPVQAQTTPTATPDPSACGGTTSAITGAFNPLAGLAPTIKPLAADAKCSEGLQTADLLGGYTLVLDRQQAVINYPETWLLGEDGDTSVVFASSQELVDLRFSVRELPALESGEFIVNVALLYPILLDTALPSDADPLAMVGVFEVWNEGVLKPVGKATAVDFEGRPGAYAFFTSEQIDMLVIEVDITPRDENGEPLETLHTYAQLIGVAPAGDSFELEGALFEMARTFTVELIDSK